MEWWPGPLLLVTSVFRLPTILYLANAYILYMVHTSQILSGISQLNRSWPTFGLCEQQPVRQKSAEQLASVKQTCWKKCSWSSLDQHLQPMAENTDRWVNVGQFTKSLRMFCTCECTLNASPSHFLLRRGLLLSTSNHLSFLMGYQHLWRNILSKQIYHKDNS